MYTTYDFNSVSVVFSHPSVGQYVATGKGIGTITITMAADRTAHEVAADGSVMVSKIRNRTGSAALSILQTSALHKWLLRWYNYVESTDASMWASMTITVRSAMMQDLESLSGVSPQKLPDKPYQAQGQNVSWTLMAADVQQDIA